jgi:O-antigen/teichoic acid export membrane protein
MPRQSRLTGALSVTVAQAVVLLFGYVAHLWIGRALGPESYGDYGIVLNIQTIAGIILTLGVPMAVSRFVAQDESHARHILWQALRIQGVIALVVALLTALAAPLISGALGDDSLTTLIQFVAAVIFLQAFYQIFTQFLSGMHYFNRQAALTTLYATMKLIGSISLIYILGVFGAFAGFAIGGIFAAAAGWYWTKGIGGSAPHHLPMRPFLSFASTYVLTLIGLQFLISLDLFMVKAFLQNDVLAGLYTAAVTLSRIPYLLLQSLTFILLPSISALTRPGASRIQAVSFIRDVLRYLIALIVPGAALAAATSKSLLNLFFSSAYIPAAPALTILMIGLGALAFYLLLANIIAGAGRALIGLGFTGIILLTSTALGIVLVPSLGLVGAALQTTLASLLGLAMISAYTFRTFRIPVPVHSILNILVATAIAVSITYFWSATPIQLPLQYLLVFAVYVLALIALGEISSADRGRIAQLHPALYFLAQR